LLLSEFNVAREDFWFGWTYPAITQTITMRIERQPDDSKKPDSDIGSKYDMDSLFS